jgi:hypothetical protein
VHVTDHALARWNRRRHLMPQRMPSFTFSDGRVEADAGSAVAVWCIRACCFHITVVGVHYVARCAARIAIITRIVVGAKKPTCRVIEARLGDVEDRNGDPQPGAWAAIGLADIWPSRLLETLQLSLRVGVADLRELGANVAATALKHTENVTGREYLPGWQRIEFGHDPVASRHLRGRRHRRHQFCRLSIARVCFAHRRMLERQDAVVVGAGSPEHCRRGHQAALGRHDDAQVTRAAGLAGDPVIAWVKKADELGRFAVQQRIGTRRLDARGIVPLLRVARLDMRCVERAAVFAASGQRDCSTEHSGIATVAIGAAEGDPRAGMHGQRIGRRMAAPAAGALGRGLGFGLLQRRWRSTPALGRAAHRRARKQAEQEKSPRDPAHGHGLNRSKSYLSSRRRENLDPKTVLGLSGKSPSIRLLGSAPLPTRGR